MNKKLNIGIVGGGFGKYGIIPAFRLDPRCSILAVCTKSILTSKKISEDFSIANSFTDYKKMISEIDLDIIAIATIPSIQEKIIYEAINKNIHIFCEKPTGTSYKKIFELNNLIQKKEIKSCIDFPFTEIEEFQELKMMLKNKQVGEIKKCNISWYFNAHHIKNNIPSWKSNKNEGGGLVSMYAAHTLNYIEYFFGKIVKILIIETNETRLKINFKTLSGLTIETDININSEIKKVHKIEIHGTKKNIILLSNNPLRFSDFFIYLSNEEYSPNKVKKIDSDERYLYVNKLVKKFINSIELNTDMYPNFKEGLRNQYLIEMIETSDILNNWIEI